MCLCSDLYRLPRLPCARALLGFRCEVFPYLGLHGQTLGRQLSQVPGWTGGWKGKLTRDCVP